jgi:hypothetical protein
MVFKPRTLSDEAAAIAKVIYLEDGYTPADIGRLMGVTHDAVRYAIKDVLRPRKDPTKLIAAIEGGNHYIPSLLQLGYCYSSCEYHLKKYKERQKNATKKVHKQATRAVR